MAKKLLFSVLFIVMGITLASAQDQPITIGGKRNNIFYHNGMRINSMSELKERISSNELALRHFRRAQTNQVMSCIGAFAGGFMIGWPLGQAIGGKVDPNWYVLAGGAGVIALCTPFIIGHKKQLTKAVEVYNEGINPRLSDIPDFSISFSPTPGGMGLTLSF